MSRKKQLQAGCSLIDRSAAHAALYGQTNRERLLYDVQASEKLAGIRMNASEADACGERAIAVGLRQVNDSFFDKDKNHKYDYEETLQIFHRTVGELVNFYSR